ncbi:NUDIX hydrolase [Occultella glacieicola]|uniref:NUDIX hydrolase n=1 Tax=Occultella glacieicola TaxID=2518684 RepID=A0ABY2DWT4_9MICO|nr:bifunctional NUDIX hydrolase/histidine phosphatase family protein [Occultella glacieicola]TDE88324.1 NUDIX hydrolase [Occultella glacieicola]
MQAAGALVWRTAGRRLEVLLIHRPRYDDWSWPKGKLDGDGESLPMCAVREVKEETGISVVLGVPLPSVRYRLTDGRVKVCTYWAATPAPQECPAIAPRGRIKDASKHEVDESRWVEARAARKLLTRSDDVEPLEALLDLWDDGLLDTWTVIVARHGRARSRSSWKGGEPTRPLTPVGAKQAGAMVPILAAYGVEEVLSSPWERCVATMGPYLDASGLDLITAPQLTETAATKNKPAVRSFVGDLLGARRRPTVVCTHRPVLPVVLTAISARSPYRLSKALPDRDPYLRTAELLVIHMARRATGKARLVALERQRGPEA